ncbi:hypothetical protein [Sulfitobacter pontiacus]|uniref:hypothetical protein n=1 Tax=Sulfitobacter pontiacus TaxID=60137 RepID=UPI0032981A91
MGFVTPFLRPSVAATTLLISVSPAAVLNAQDTSGHQVSLSVQQRLDYASNPDLNIDETDSEFFATTEFTLNVTRETAAHEFSFGAAFDLIAGRDDDDRNGFSNPNLRVDYAQESAAGTFELNAFLNEIDVDTLDFIEDVDVGTVSSVSGTGTRRRVGGGASYSFGRDATFGGSVLLNLRDTTYSDTTDTSLTDTQRTTLGTDLRFDLSPVTRATLALRHTTLEEEGQADEDIDSATLSLVKDLPNGSVTFRASATDQDSGTRKKFDLRRTLDLPRGDLRFNLGVTDPIEGSEALVGGVTWRHDLPRGEMQLRLGHDVTGDEQEDETRISSVSFRLEQQITTRWNSNFLLSYRDSRNQQSGQNTETTRVSLNFDYELTQDWDMRFGAEHRRRDRSLSGTADNTRVFMALRRDFDWAR